jgi:transcriptional regulator with XRE-family HTH domain
VDPTPIKIAVLRQGLSLKQLALQAGINVRRWYRLIEDLAVPTEDELARVAAVTGLSVGVVREALTGPSGSGVGKTEVRAGSTLETGQ